MPRSIQPRWQIVPLIDSQNLSELPMATAHGKVTFVNATESKAQIYGKEYLKWKSWGGQEFGALSKIDASYFSAEIKRTKASIAKNANVLEIGFGNGSFLAYARKRGWTVCGTEVNADLVEVAKQRGFDAKHTEDLSIFSDSTFDLIVAFDVLEHIPQDLLLRFLEEIKRILKDKGFFIARFPNGDSPFGLRNQNGDITHVTTIGSGKVRYFAAEANMKLVFVGGTAQTIVGAGALYFIHRTVALPVRKLTNAFVNAIFFPSANIEFCSLDLTMICQAVKPTQPALASDSFVGDIRSSHPAAGEVQRTGRASKF
jgi:SAM-dependent methyltransferase